MATGRRSAASSSRAGPAPTSRCAAGAAEAARQTRNHRLWEAYFTRHAAMAPAQVDRSADLAEHVLEPGILDQLERQLADDGRLPAGPGGTR